MPSMRWGRVRSGARNFLYIPEAPEFKHESHAGSSWTDASLGCPRALQVLAPPLPALQAIDLIILDGTEWQVCPIAPPITPLHTPCALRAPIGKLPLTSLPTQSEHDTPIYIHPACSVLAGATQIRLLDVELHRGRRGCCRAAAEG